MAIERLIFYSDQDVADAIDSLGWFDDVSVESGTITCSVNNEPYLITKGVGAGSFSFYPLGYNNDSDTKIVSAHSGYYYGFKTKNGLLLVHSLDARTDAYYNFALIAKTNTGKLCVMTQYTSGNASNGAVQMAAAGESSSEISLPLQFTGGYYMYASGASVPKWVGSSQTITCPLPTHPASGKSYIEGALGLVLYPNYDTGIVDIDGTRYVTNGYIALNDEE